MKDTITRRHFYFAIDTKDPKEGDNTISKVDNILRESFKNDEIENFYFEHNFNEDVSHEEQYHN